MKGKINKYRVALAYAISFLVVQGIDFISAKRLHEGRKNNRILSSDDGSGLVTMRMDHFSNASRRPTVFPGSADRPQPLFQPNPGQSQLEELAQQRELWESWNITHYKLISQRSCFCTEEMRAQTLVTVDTVTGNRSVINAETRRPMSDNSPVLSFVPTVDYLFDVLTDALEQRAHQIDVEYDETYGFIKSLYVDYDPRIADEETNIVVRSFFPVSEVELALEENRLKWKNTMGAVQKNYRFAFRHVAKNQGDQVVTYRYASIVDGEFESIFSLTAARAGERDALHLYTIPEYFEWIASVLRDETSYNRLSVEFDPEHGFPSEIVWDQFWLNGNPIVISINQVEIVDKLDLSVPSEAAGDNSTSEFDTVLEVNSLEASGTTSRKLQCGSVLSSMVAIAMGRMLL